MVFLRKIVLFPGVTQRKPWHSSYHHILQKHKVENQPLKWHIMAWMTGTFLPLLIYFVVFCKLTFSSKHTSWPLLQEAPRSLPRQHMLILRLSVLSSGEISLISPGSIKFLCHIHQSYQTNYLTAPIIF